MIKKWIIEYTEDFRNESAMVQKLMDFMQGVEKDESRVGEQIMTLVSTKIGTAPAFPTFLTVGDGVGENPSPVPPLPRVPSLARCHCTIIVLSLSRGNPWSYCPIVPSLSCIVLSLSRVSNSGRGAPSCTWIRMKWQCQDNTGQ